MGNDVAPVVFISYAHDSPEHKDRVRQFATFLEVRIGLRVELDQWDDNVRRDWSLWATKQLTGADFVVVVASPEYRKRAEGSAPPHEGRGSQFEAAMLRDFLTKDLGAATERILPVVLPGGSIDDIPAFLSPYSATHFRVSQVTDDGVAELIAAITGIGKYPRPQRGEWRHGRPAVARTGEDLRWLASSPQVRMDSATIDGRSYPASIVLHSTSEMTAAFAEIDLGGAYERFTSVVGVLDDAREPHQVARFRALVDGKPVAECQAALGKPREVDIAVAGGLTLRLEMYRPTGSADVAWGDPALS